jgi:siroheme synthase (precorrin-2 oxidase/ferrochelatase)
MTKFSKRMRKLDKRSRNVLVVGTALEQLEDLLETFATVFVISNTAPRLQKRNVVYREDFDNIHLLTDIDLIIIDINQEHTIPELIQVWRRTNPTIVIQGPELISKDFQKLLKVDHYAIIEVAKGYYVWKNKK